MNNKLVLRIVNLREAYDWTQKELADRMGFNKVTMNKIEHGNRAVTNEELAKFADLFKVTTDYLLGKNQTPSWATKQDTKDLKEFLESNEGSITFGGVDLTPEQDAQVRVAMATIFWNEKKKEKK
ncbi:helix-turn-helix domain-containing protein [Levilactobacillus huananensis]|uniref:helix-turn-helix domain-containing protein n=1 Tax=Levilactobacillus huananensis TaxID=2486019 RepID=UPI000F774DE9|nr:helix-turn-helix transcriptional regulator [Levilactobacillus huananensis]